MTPIDADVAVIGAGIAGVGTAAELAADATVVLLEQEPVPAYHTTGRSAAMFLESYGGELVRGLTTDSRAGFEAVRLLTPRPLLWVTPPGTDEPADADPHLAGGPAVEPVSAAEAMALCPVLRPEWTGRALLEPGAQEIDVAGLHQHFLGRARRRGVDVLLSAGVSAGRRDGGRWVLDTAAGPVRAPVVVNAAGAWADAVAVRCGLDPIGLTPLRRTVAVARHSAVDRSWPLVSDLAETFYFRPEGPGVLISPADETPAAAHDARPEAAAVALALDRVNAATTLGLRSVAAAWAGLRTFAPDREPVVGPDPAGPGFCWLAGLGGFGIQTAPALARLAARAAVGAGPVPAALSVARFRPGAATG